MGLPPSNADEVRLLNLAEDEIRHDDVESEIVRCAPSLGDVVDMLAETAPNQGYIPLVERGKDFIVRRVKPLDDSSWDKYRVRA